MAAQTYFAGMHTGRGYEQYWEELLPKGEDARLCLVRGAAGTGRHALIGRLADLWQQQGREVLCLADAEAPDRLAGAVCGSMAVADISQSCPLEPGANDLVLDFSRALDLDVLRPSRGDLIRLYRRMQSLRARAARCLQVAQTARQDTAAIYAEATDTGALCNLRMELSAWLQGAPGSRRRVFAQGITAAGVISHADSLLRPQTLCLDLPWGMDADTLLRPAAVGLQARGAGYIAALQPLDGGSIAHLCTDTHAVVSFVQPGCPVRTLRLQEDVLRRERDALAFNRAACDLWTRQAMEAMAAARELRQQLERLTADALLPDKRESLIQEGLAFFR